MKFQILYSFLENNFHYRDQHDPHKLVKKFAELHGLNEEQLVHIVNAFGGHNDFEVALNLPNIISEDIDIEEEFTTLEEFAKKNNIFCKLPDELNLNRSCPT
jgi:hypothetical protein